MTITFEVPGKPQGKARPRVVRNKYTGKAHGITPEKTRHYEELIRMCYMMAGGLPFGDGVQIEMDIVAEFAIPKSYSKARVSEIVQNGLRPTCKPDVDNIQKVVLDALNERAYRDDAQVVRISCEKMYAGDGHGRVVVQIAEI